MTARRTPAPTPRMQRGAAGEEAAARYLESQGYSVLARNHRCRLGEVDLIVARGPLVAFVEVRTRSTRAFGGPAATVDAAKQARVIRAARDWLARAGGPERELRFDVVAVVEGQGGLELEHLPGAFEVPAF